MTEEAAKSKFYLGDYEGCLQVIKNSFGTNLSGEIKSIWFRSLIHLGQFDEANSRISPATESALDKALLIYAALWPLRHVLGSGHQKIGKRESQLLEAATGLTEERDEAAVILALIYNWMNDLSEAYRLAAASPTLEA